jgi:hypothetical protein
MIYSTCILISLIAMRDKSHTPLRLDSNSTDATELGPEPNSSCEDENGTANHTTFVNALMDAPKTYTTDESGQQCKQRSH